MAECPSLRVWKRGTLWDPQGAYLRWCERWYWLWQNLYNLQNRKLHMYIFIFFFGTRNGKISTCKISLKRKMIIHLYTHFLPTFFLDFLLPSILPWIFVYYLMGTWTLFNLNCAVIWIKVHHHVRFVKKVYCLTDEIYTYKKNDHTNVYTKYFGWMEKGRNL